MKKLVGKKIRSVRGIKNFSQDYVASKLGISQNAYSKVERGEISIDDEKLANIALILEVSVEDILNYDPDNYLKTKSLSSIESMLRKLTADVNEIKEKFGKQVLLLPILNLPEM